MDKFYAKVHDGFLATYLEVHEQSKIDQFLMNCDLSLRLYSSNLMSCDPFFSLDICFEGLLHEEQYLSTQATFQQDILPVLSLLMLLE